MFFKIPTKVAIVLIIILLVVIISCYLFLRQENSSVSQTAEILETIKTDSSFNDTYLVLSGAEHKIKIMFDKVVLREYLFEILADDVDFFKEEKESSISIPDTSLIERVHLISAARKVSSSELQIIAEELNTDTSMIQRYIPGQFAIDISNNLRINVESDCQDPNAIEWEQEKEFFRSLSKGIFGSRELKLKISADDAVSLYGFTRNSPKILIIK